MVNNLLYVCWLFDRGARLGERRLTVVHAPATYGQVHAMLRLIFEPISMLSHACSKKISLFPKKV